MTLETKKMLAVVGSTLAGMATLSGVVLMALQIKTQGAGFFVTYLLYALAILAGGMFVTWIPTAQNFRWGFKSVEGKLKWTKYTNIVDPRRTRLILWPLTTLFFELFGLFSFSYDIWDKPTYEAMKYLFVGLTVLTLAIWMAITMVEEQRMKRQENNKEN